MSKTSVHEIESDFQVRRMVDFCQNTRNSCTRNNAIKVVEALSHSSSKNNLICLGVSDSTSTIKKFDLTSSSVEL